MTAMQNIGFVRLYKNHGSSVGFWEGWVEGHADEAKIILQYARTMDGKVTRKEHPAKRKNIGRSNETTCLEQAQLELDSRANKQLDKGYVKTQEEAKLPSTNTLGLTKPMLAQPMDKVGADKIDWENAWAQPKLDGHRAMFKDGTLYSRQGKVIDLPHIVDAIKELGLDQFPLDGELYLHGKTLQEIGSLVKRNQPESLGIVYYVYDVVGDQPWIERTEPFRDALYSVTEVGNGPVQALVSRKVNNPEELQTYHEENTAAGYEGTMLRWGVLGYQDGKRSKQLLKLKNFQDFEFTIVAVNRGVPYIKDEVQYEVPVWVCDAGNGETFTCTAQGDMHRKHELWLTREQHVGKQLTVKFHYYSKDGIPQLPVALRFRDDL